MSKSDKIEQLRRLLKPYNKQLGFYSLKRYKVGESINDTDLFKCSDNGEIMPYKSINTITPRPFVWKICGL